MRRLWILSLIASAVLMIGMAVLGSASGTANSLLLGSVIAVILYFSPPHKQVSDP